MGTRRMRDLHQRKDLEVGLYDERADRRAAAQAKFGVKTFASLDEALAWGPKALVVSTPPGTKGAYVKLALERGLHHFIEADIWSYNGAEVERISREKKLVSAPSASLRFLPVVRGLEKLVLENLCTFLSYQLSMATFMPGWHKGEGAEYYARHRNTAPSREMIAFELNWLAPIFSPAVEVAGRFEKYGQLPGDTEDTWSLQMRLRNGGVGQVVITMCCPVDHRMGTAYGTNGVISWDIYGGTVTVQTAADLTPRRHEFGDVPKVLEAMYLEEITTFIAAAKGEKTWPQNYALSQHSSATLAAAEKSFVTGQWCKVEPNTDPDPVLPRRK